MLICPKCQATLAKEYFNTEKPAHCPVCRVDFRTDVYPAMFRPLERSGTGDVLTADRQASCFFHEHKKAVIACNSCGRFLCALCDLEISGRHICPLCLQSGRSKRKLKNFENNRVCYDSIALYVAVLPMLVFWLTVLSAPIAIFISIRHWKSPSSIIPRTKVRFVVAICIAALQISGWILVIGSTIA